MRKFLLASLSALLLSACGGNDDVLTVAPDGTVINLGTSAKGWVEGKGDNNGYIVGYNQGESFYGTWTDDNKTYRKVYAYGTDVTNMPSSGQAEYNGHAIRMNPNGEAYNAGAFKFAVDFGAKAGVGAIKTSTGPDVVLNVARLSADGELNGQAYTISGVPDIFSNNDQELASAIANGTVHQRGRYEANLHGNGASQITGVADFGDVSVNTAFGGTR